MKILFSFLGLIVAGCQAPNTPVLPAPKPPPPPAPAISSQTTLEKRVRQQAQYIEALLSQNDALASRLAAAEAKSKSPAKEVLPIAVGAASPASEDKPEPVLEPNADGVIDLAAPVAEPTANPFAMRMAAEGSSRQVVIRVAGIVAGPTALAIMNDRMVQAGDTMESLTVDRIMPDAVILQAGGRKLRLPVSGKPVRVRLPN